MVIPLDQVRSAVALAFDSDGNMIYWSDVESHRISRSFLNGSNQEVIISSNLGEYLNILNILNNLFYLILKLNANAIQSTLVQSCNHAILLQLLLRDWQWTGLPKKFIGQTLVRIE